MISINNETEFMAFIDKLDDEEFVTSQTISSVPLSVSFKITGTGFDSSLTGAFIQTLADYQNKIYRAYRLYRRGGKSRRPLTEYEKRGLEINVEVKQGCTEAVLSLGLDLLKELGDNMTGQEIFNCAAIVSIAWAAKSIACTAISGHFKTKRDEAAHKAETADTDAKKQYFSSVASIMSDALTCAKDIVHGLVSIAPKNIEVDGVPLNAARLADMEEDLSERTDAEAADRPDVYIVEGMFRVLSINYEKSVTLMKAVHVESGEEFDDILLQDGWMTTENMTILDNAQERTPVFFRVICERRRRRFIHTIDVNSISKQKQTI